MGSPVEDLNLAQLVPSQPASPCCRGAVGPECRPPLPEGSPMATSPGVVMALYLFLCDKEREKEAPIHGGGPIPTTTAPGKVVGDLIGVIETDVRNFEEGILVQ
ncbi:hypothetical protein CRG98_030458 [Punica granatum]|uniref:Uncharacterized protein n=1 Tax=Punica granatum TaxID=22663 RepID=A0A2I0IYL8_PUNGR|nr:hypothetical protein CRG98_030458 [Punica granatum]